MKGMEDNYIGAITTDDLKEIKEMFESALEEGLSEIEDSRIDKTKVVNQYENDIRQKIRIDYPQTEQIKVQELKGSIENMEKKAKKMKEQIINNRNRFIEAVRSNIDAQLKSRMPECPEIDLDQKITISDEDNHSFQLLDQEIELLESMLNECDKNIQKFGPYEKFCDQTYNALFKD